MEFFQKWGSVLMPASSTSPGLQVPQAGFSEIAGAQLNPLGGVSVCPSSPRMRWGVSQPLLGTVSSNLQAKCRQTKTSTPSL